MLVLYFHLNKAHSFPPNTALQIQIVDSGHGIFFLSMNVEEFCSIGQTSSLHQANLQMVVNKNCPISKNDREGNMEKILVQPDRQLTALQMVLAPDLFN